MEAVEFIRTIQKMCTGRHCDDCPMSENYRCNVCYTEDPEESVRIVEEWAKEQESDKTEQERQKTEQERQKTEQERQKTEQERQNPEYPEESSDLHAIIDEEDFCVDKSDIAFVVDNIVKEMVGDTEAMVQKYLDKEGNKQ